MIKLKNTDGNEQRKPRYSMACEGNSDWLTCCKYAPFCSQSTWFPEFGIRDFHGAPIKQPFETFNDIEMFYLDGCYSLGFACSSWQGGFLDGAGL
jgi:hypothetical protein